MRRFFTPGQLAICTALFFLPWIEIQCVMPDLGGLKDFGAKEGPPAAKKTASAAKAWSPLMSQSGFQVATGEFTMVDPLMRAMMDAGKKHGEPPAKEDDISPAPILFGYLGAVALGTLLGLILPTGAIRKVTLLLLCAVAVGIAGKMVVAGFPVENNLHAKWKKDRHEKGDDAKSKNEKMEDELRVQHKWPLYLSLALVVGAVLTTIVEPGVRKPAPPRSARPPADDEPELPLND